MNHEHVNLTFIVYWQFKDYPHLKVTKCKRIIDCQKGKLLKYGVRGFFIKGNYYKRKEINTMIKRIKKDLCPF
jgi:hypothetical protein